MTARSIRRHKHDTATIPKKAHSSSVCRHSQRLYRQSQPHCIEDGHQAVERRITFRRERTIKSRWVQVRLFGYPCTPPKAWAIWDSTISSTAWSPSSRMPLTTSSANAGPLRHSPAITSSWGLLLIIYSPLPVLPVIHRRSDVRVLHAFVCALNLRKMGAMQKS